VYDLDGNLREDAGINTMGYGLKFEWDSENRLTAVRKADNTLLATYVYDHLGRRIRKTTTSAAYQGASDTAYLYDGWNVVAEYSITSGPAIALLQAYTWGLDLSGSMQGAGGVGGLLCVHRSPGTDGSGDRNWADAFYPTYDGNGNVSEYLDENGDEVAHFEYDPFGRIVASTGTPAAFTYRFSTKSQDFETALYYYGYRYYGPILGRWPSADPLEKNLITGEFNEYSFVKNRPLEAVDVLGLQISGPYPPPGEIIEEIGIIDAWNEVKKGGKTAFKKLFGGGVRVTCCNDFPDLLKKWRYIPEFGAADLTAFPDPNPDGQYAVDAVYRPGAGFKIEDGGNPYIRCNCDEGTITTNVMANEPLLWGALGGRIYEWRAEDPNPPAGANWPGGPDGPRPYYDSP
jgi:RHS repeat-associated protein